MQKSHNKSNKPTAQNILSSEESKSKIIELMNIVINNLLVGNNYLHKKRYYKFSDLKDELKEDVIEPKKLFLASMLQKNPNILLFGYFGTGKTTTVELIADMFNFTVDRIQGMAGTNDISKIGVTSAIEPLINGKIEPSYPNFAKDSENYVMLIDEMNRFAPTEIARFIPLLAERKMPIVSGGLSDDLPVKVDGLSIVATINEQDSSTSEMLNVVLDRFNASFNFASQGILVYDSKNPQVQYFIKLSLLYLKALICEYALSKSKDFDSELERKIVDLKYQLAKNLTNKEENKYDLTQIEEYFKTNLSSLLKHGILEIKKEIADVEVGKEVLVYLELFRANMDCLQGRGADGRKNCGNCNENGNACSCLSDKFTFPTRSIMQIIELAKAHAFLSGRKQVDLHQDMLPAVYANLLHKISLNYSNINNAMSIRNYRDHLDMPNIIGNNFLQVSKDKLVYSIIKEVHSVVVDKSVKISNLRENAKAIYLKHAKDPNSVDLQKFDEEVDRYLFQHFPSGLMNTRVREIIFADVFEYYDNLSRLNSSVKELSLLYSSNLTQENF